MVAARLVAPYPAVEDATVIARPIGSARRRRRTAAAACAFAAAASVALTACDSGDVNAVATTSVSASTTTVDASANSPVAAPSSSVVAQPPTAPTPANTVETIALLDTLPVKGRAPKTGYTRDQFGPAWTDDVDVQFGGNSCDTRNDILKRDLTNIVFRDGNCTVQSGTLVNDPYTGKTIDFVRGKDTSSAIQIEHVVALSDSWQKGAQQLSERERRNFANDPDNLIAVDGPANMAKGDGDAATWLPDNKAYRCTYVTKQVQVKAKYRLWVTQAEKDAITRVLGACDNSAPNAAAPTNSSEDSPAPLPPAPAPAPPPAPAPAPAPSSSGSFGSCKEARAAGAAPLHRGEPGYSPKLDRDGDGVACE
ncbi:DUF1524 domain-containing protein [Rhodococcus hoagii]|nr:DUF1524 domain-containing protein [Prescottella equi]NKR80622.1 DUF1524 domain-containing protein [Prescottella equi]